MYSVKMIIAGGRDFEDYTKCRVEVTKIINLLYNEKAFKKEEICIIGGRAKGADALGEYYANQNDIYIYTSNRFLLIGKPMVKEQEC